MGTRKSISLRALDDGWTLDDAPKKSNPPPIPHRSLAGMASRRIRQTGPAAFAPTLRMSSPVKSLRPEDLEEFSAYDLAQGTGVDLAAPKAAWFLELRDIVPAKSTSDCEPTPLEPTLGRESMPVQSQVASNGSFETRHEEVAKKPSSWWQRIRNK